MLALLLLNAGSRVGREQITEFLWAGRAPSSAVNVVQTYVRRLRAVLEPERSFRGPSVLLRSLPDGYLLDPEAAAIDLAEYRALVGAAGTAAVSGAAEAAAALLRRAAELRYGAPLADLGPAIRGRPEVVRLTHELAQSAIAWSALPAGTAALADLQEFAALLPMYETLHAALVRTLSAAGRRAEALAAYQAIRLRLREELGLDPAQELRRAHLEALAANPGRPAALSTGLSTGPPTGHLLGRDHDQHVLAGLVGGRRVLTLTGPGGVGKSALALAVAERAAPAYGGRLVLAELGHLPPSEVLGPVAGQVLGAPGVRHRDRATPDAAGVAAALPPRCLLVLDGAEQVLPGCAALAGHLVRARPDVDLLVTSRRPLDLVEETVWHVAPLAGEHSAELFLRAAARSAPRLDLTGDPGLVAELCRRLEHLPLALDLAAAQLRSLSPYELLDQLATTGYGLLRRTAADRPPHQRTLTASIERSIGLLTVPQNLLLFRLARLPGPFTLADAEEAVADLPGRSGAALLSDLVDHSMVQHEGDTFRLLLPIRHYMSAPAGAPASRC